MEDKNFTITNLEIMLVSLGCKRPFKKNGDMSKSGWKAYDKLMSILVYLKNNNVINFRQDDLDRWVNEVVKTNI